MAAYLAVLATWTVVHDSSTPVAGRIIKGVGAWLLPVGVAVMILRSAEELAPETLPAKHLLVPIRWLMRTSPQRPNNLADDNNEFVGSGRHNDD
jgi:hypothetical protein